MKILFLIPSKLDGPSARYVIDLSYSLNKHNISTVISSEDEKQNVERENCNAIQNIKMPNLGDFDSFENYLAKIRKINIDVVFAIGSRVKIDIIALSLKKYGVSYIKQFEDDEETIFLNCNKNTKKKDYSDLLHKGFNDNLNEIDFKSLHKREFKVIDPYVKGLTLSALDGYSKIWGDLCFDEEEYLKTLKFLSLPPVCSQAEIQALQRQVSHYSSASSPPTYFIGGSIYSKEDSDIFISAWKDFKKIAFDAKLIISYSRTARKLIEHLVAEYDGRDDISVLDLPSDIEYRKVFSMSEYILSIGGGQFDEKRLPSRLVKSLHLGKKILTPCVGFGKALIHKENAFVCMANTKDDWLKTLHESYEEKSRDFIGKNASNFAIENFDVIKVAYNTKKFLFETTNKKTPNSIMTANFNDIDIENCLMADVIGLSNMVDKGKSRPAIKRVKYRLIHVGNCLFLQTLERPDYNFQVECSAAALINKSALNDTGFKYLQKHGGCDLFDLRINPSLSGKEVVDFLQKLKGKFLNLSVNARSALLDKLILSFRLYKLMNELVTKLDIKIIFFHADMQLIESLASSLFNKYNSYNITDSLQHAIF